MKNVQRKIKKKIMKNDTFNPFQLQGFFNQHFADSII